ncbi:MAG: NAD(P)H-binding protein [Actinomycetota bacterium]|nr:NAD(P)H-binding protein [Actinomycetota bacterium]
MHIAVAGSTGLVGSQVVRVAEAAGHTVVGIARATGVDLTTGAGLTELLTGADALIDVTQSPTIDLTAVEFFETVAANLGDAATRAGVGRTVVLSIIGIDDVPELDYYIAKTAQERTHRAHSPGLRILRAAQFHEFAEMSIVWGRNGDTTTVDDLVSQPVATAEIARVLVELATGEREGELVELAGPKREQIADLARRVVARRGENLTVVAREAPDSIKGGALLPGPDAIIAGPTFDEWLKDQRA